MRPSTYLGSALIALTAASFAAQAAISTYVSVSAGFNSNSSTGSAPQYMSISGVGVEGRGNAGAAAQAGFGTLGASATGTATPASAFPTVQASANAQFIDDLFISGPLGAQVSVTFSLNLLGGCFASPGASGGFANAACSAGGKLFGPPALLLGVSDQNRFSSTTITWAANASMPIGADLSAGGYAWNGSFNAGFADTLHVYAYSTTPGVVITSGSGHDYSVSAVPEPGTWLLLLAGVIGMVPWVWSRSSAGGTDRSAICPG